MGKVSPSTLPWASGRESSRQGQEGRSGRGEGACEGWEYESGLALLRTCKKLPASHDPSRTAPAAATSPLATSLSVSKLLHLLLTLSL